MAGRTSIDDIAELDNPEKEEIDELNKLVAIQINLAEVSKEMTKEERSKIDYGAMASIKRTLDFVDAKIAILKRKADLEFETLPELTPKEKEKKDGE
jgi:hypothetical protein